MSNISYKAGNGNFLGLIRLVPKFIQFLKTVSPLIDFDRKAITTVCCIQFNMS